MGKRFLGIGECMVELAPEGPGLWRQGFAGDVFNALWYARAALGEEDAVGFHTGLGRDALSAEFEEFAESHGIGLGESPRFDDATLGLYAIRLRDGERSFSYWRDTSAARRLASDRARLERRVAEADLVYLSGISIAILPPEDRDGLYAVLATARSRCTVAFDPNVRPRLWSDAETMREEMNRFAGVARIVLPGLEDEGLLTDATADGTSDVTAVPTAETVARRYLALGAERVIVKDGGRRVTVRGDVRLDLPLEPIGTPLDTTGAGDAFAGTCLAELLAGEPVEVAIARAHACAAVVVMTRGALCPHGRLPRHG